MFYKKYIYIILFFNTTVFSEMLFTYEYSNSKHSYGLELIMLSFEKTKEKYGEYRLIKAPIMNRERAFLTLKSNKLNNLILKLSASKEIIKDFSCVNFPVDRGIVGYRVAFISPKMKAKIKEYDTLEKIKELKIGQGRGWLDNDILRFNGFKVTSLASKESIINMLSLNRIDLFFRGVNEIYLESKISHLDIDKSFMLYYPLPRFFCINKKNKILFKRLKEGLKIVYEDGSLDSLFNKYYLKNINFLDMKKRTLYKIENPFLKGIDKSYEKYIYNPFKEEKG